MIENTLNDVSTQTFYFLKLTFIPLIPILTLFMQIDFYLFQYSYK